MASEPATASLLKAFDVVWVIDREGRIESALHAPATTLSPVPDLATFELLEGPALPINQDHLPAEATYRSGGVVLRGRILPDQNRLVFCGREASREIQLKARVDELEEKCVAGTWTLEQSQLEAIVNTVSTAITILDADGRITFANERARTILGLEIRDVISRRYDDPAWKSCALDGGPWPDDAQPFRRVMASRAPVFDVRHSIVWPDGRRKSLSINGRPVFDQRGEVVRVVFSIEDITRILENEDELHESREALSLCIDGSGIGTWDWNVQTGTVNFNDHWARMLGFELDEISPDVSSWERLVHPDDLQEAMVALREHFDGKTSIYRFEHRLLTKSGDWKWILDSGRVFSRDAGGKPLRMFGTHLDIDVVKRAEEKRRELELRVQKAARYESMSELASGIAHEFNNLLVGIIGAAGIARLDLDANSSLLPTIQMIESAGQRASELTQQMIAFAGKGRYIVEPLDLNALIHEMSEFMGSASGRKIRIGYHLTQVPKFEADASQIRQVILNLVMNAIDACERMKELQEPPVEVRTCVVELDRDAVAAMDSSFDLEPGRFVCLDIIDHGLGMEDRVAERIFDPFFSTKGCGHGFGLAAVMGIVKGHAGFVRVRSEKGVGSEIRVGFPLAPGQNEGKNMVTDTPSKARSAILVIDDEELVSTVIRIALQRKGYEVMLAANGREGIALFSAEHSRLAMVYLDMSMPGMGGAEVLGHLKAIAPKVPVIVMSGLMAEEAGVGSLKDQIAGFVKKPFRPDELIIALEQGLLRPRA